MQHKKFEGGGGVIHKITGDFKGRVSAWYDKEGKMIDAEQIILWASRPVKKNGPIWQEVEKKVKFILATEK